MLLSPEAYERWCAGYRCVRETKQHLQQLRRLARLWMSEEDLEWMDGQLATFPAYLGTFLGGQAQPNTAERPASGRAFQQFSDALKSDASIQEKPRIGEAFVGGILLGSFFGTSEDGVLRRSHRPN